MGTVEAYPSMDSLLRLIGSLKPSRVHLAPFMIVAGDHAHNDLAGDDADSWKSHFEQAGYPVLCHLKGLGEYEGIRQQSAYPRSTVKEFFMHMHHHNTGGIAIDSYACNSRLRLYQCGIQSWIFRASASVLYFCRPLLLSLFLLILFAASVTVFLGGIPLHDYLSVLGIPVFCAAWRHRHRCRFLFTADWRFLPESVFLLPLCHVCSFESVFSDAESVRCRKLHVPNDTFHTVTRTFLGSP